MRRLIQVAALLLLSVAIAAQQRDSTAKPAAGTGEISGAILSADQNPQPVRRVVVTITAPELPAARNVITADDGRFVFGGLPPGHYAISARKAAYIQAEFGSPKPGRPGTRLALAAGERRAVTLTLFRGAAIGGTLRDHAGAPVGGVSVTALDARAVANEAANQAPGGSVVTDDRGRYRIYGLPPGDYVLSASPSPGGSGEIAASSTSDIDAAIAVLTQRQAGSIPTQIANSQLQALPTPRSIGYSPTYFPGTAFYPDATRIRLTAGESRDAIDFPITHVPVASIEGVISGAVPNLSTVMIAITPDGPRTGAIMGANTITSKPPNEKGEFQYGNLTPGRYRIVARSRAGGEPPPPAPGTTVVGGGRGGAPLPGGVMPPTGDMLYAVADVDVRGQNVTGVSLPLQPGGTISGRLVFDTTSKVPLPDKLSDFRLHMLLQGGNWSSSSGNTRMGPAISSVAPVSVREDGTFLIQGVGPGRYVLEASAPGGVGAVWMPRAVIHEGRDLSDIIIEGPNVQLRDVAIMVSDKRTEIAGVLQSASGQPATEFYVIAFSTDRAYWRNGARRTRSARPATDGRFVFVDLPAGEYFIAALTDFDPLEWQTAAFLDEVAPSAIKVSLAEGERKRTDIRIK